MSRMHNRVHPGEVRREDAGAISVSAALGENGTQVIKWVSRR